MHMHAYYESTAAGIEAKLAALEPGEPSARKRLALGTARLGARLFSTDEQVAWCGVLAPFDLLHAMDLTSCYVEFLGTTLAGTGGAAHMLERAEHIGYPSDCCSYHRSVIGAMEEGLLPEPEVVIATSCPCTGGLAVLEEVARRFAKPMFVLHIPYRRDEESVRYLANQLEQMIGFVAAHTGRRLDRERLAEVIERSNRARAAMVEMYRLARSVPFPARPRDLVNFALSIALLYGSDEAIQIAETYRDELAHNREHRSLPPERLRLLWMQNRIQFRNPVETLLHDEHGAIVVADELNSVTWEPIDPHDPLPGLARRMQSIPLSLDLDYRISHLIEQAKDYQVDGVLNPCHWGCRQGAGSRGLVEAALKPHGIGVLNLEVDCVDERAFSEGQVRTRLQAFLEMLGERRAVGGRA